MTNHELEYYDRAVLVEVDPQVDFCPGGTLGVFNGDHVIQPLNRVAQYIRKNNGLVVRTRDYHTLESKHLARNGGIWDDHTIVGTKGAEFHPDLEIEDGDVLITKGLDINEDAYSGFEGKADDGRNLEQIVTPEEDQRVVLLLGGLATDYCVKRTGLDGCTLADKINYPQNSRKLDIFVLSDAIKAVNLKPNDGDLAIAELKLHGAHFVTSQEVINGQVFQIGANHEL